MKEVFLFSKIGKTVQQKNILENKKHLTNSVTSNTDIISVKKNELKKYERRRIRNFWPI